MKKFVFGLAVLGLMAGSVAAQYHNPVYVVGGNGRVTTTELAAHTNGLYIADANTQTYTHLTPGMTIYESRGFTMDRDNKSIVMAVGSPFSTYRRLYTHQAGLFRVDPVAKTIQTIRAGYDTYYPYDVVVNHDGDYVWAGSQTTGFTDPGIYKTSHDGRTQTTILRALWTNINGAFSGDIDIDPATGGYMVQFSAVQDWPTRVRHPVLVVQEDGTFTSFNDGSTYGWQQSYEHRDLNWANQTLEGQYMGKVVQLPQGSGGITTLATLSVPGNHGLRWTSKFDLQSAPSKQIVCHGMRQAMLNGRLHQLPVMFYIDRTSLAVTRIVDVDATASSGRRLAKSMGIDFYRGRHISTTKTADRKWDLNISVPGYAGKGYLAAVSMGGYVPGIQLADGRTLHLNEDGLTGLSVAGLLKPYFDGGPGVLDAGGEAKGSLDVSSFPKLGLPLWIAVLVLDNGQIRYVPDTFVMRI